MPSYGVYIIAFEHLKGKWNFDWEKDTGAGMDGKLRSMKFPLAKIIGCKESYVVATLQLDIRKY